MSEQNINHGDKDHGYSMIIAAFLTFIGCALLVAGFIVSPTGEIHSSALVAFGEIMTFVAAILGINSKYKSFMAQISKHIHQ